MYGKIFELMYDGSLYGQWEALVTFQQMIVLADQEGFVDITPPALAARTSIPLEIIQNGIKILESDDPYSRTADENGKRIIRMNPDRPWGWKIVNYIKYRNMASQEERREYMREYMKQYRKQEKFTDKHGVNDCKPELALLTHTDTYTNNNIYPYRSIVEYLNKKANTNFKHTTKETQRLIKARINQGFTIENFFSVIDFKCHNWGKDPKMLEYLRPKTLFGTNFESYLNAIGRKPAEPEREYIDV